VVFNGNSSFGINFQNCRYFRLTGTGSSSYQYGIKISGDYSMGVKAGQRSSDMEIDHIEVMNASINGIRANTYSNCKDGSDNDYDYDGDGKEAYDLDDVVCPTNDPNFPCRNPFTQYNTRIHDNYVHDIGDEGFYIGYNRTVYASYAQGNPSRCPVSPKEPLNRILSGVRIYSNLVKRTHAAAITVKGAPRDTLVYSNEIYESSTTPSPGQEGGIHLNLNAQCNVYNNFIKDAYAAGIIGAGIGGKIYNNVIVEPGQKLSTSEPRASGIHVLSGTQDKNYYVWNNTIVNPKSFGVYFTYRFGWDNRIQNNIIVNPGAYNGFGDSSYIYYSSDVQGKVSDNLKSRSTYQVDFENPNTDNYSLYSSSPAVNSGIDLSSQGITYDFKGTSRPKGPRFDLGAYEYAP